MFVFLLPYYIHTGGADNLGRYSFDATNSTDKFDIGVKYNVTFTKHASSSTYAMVDIPDHANCIECLIWQPEVRGLRRVCPAVMHMNVPVQGTYSNTHVRIVVINYLF